MSFNLNSIALGNMLGQSIKESQDYKQDMAETGDMSFITFAPIETINLTGSYYVKKWLLASDSFVLDHPVYGELDSSILKLDGGYAGVSEDLFPLSFPISFGSVATFELVTSGLL